MKHRTNQILFSYWNHARRGRAAPHRFDIEPARLAAILPDALIVEHRSNGDYYYRLAGTRICDTFGIELRATLFADFWSKQDFQKLETLLAGVRDQSRIALITFEAKTLDKRSALFELLLLPLTINGQTNDRFLGTMAAVETPGWLGYEPIVEVELLSADGYWPEELSQLPILAPHPTAKVPAASSRSAVRAVVTSPRFRVIEGGRSEKRSDDPA